MEVILEERAAYSIDYLCLRDIKYLVGQLKLPCQYKIARGCP